MRIGGEFDNTAIGMQMAFRKGFATNIFAQHLLSKKYVCPYVGTSLGFHWVSHSDQYERFRDQQDYQHHMEKRGDGFEINIDAGLRLFRTYGFQLNLDLAYSISFNDFNDRAIVFTMGFLP